MNEHYSDRLMKNINIHLKKEQQVMCWWILSDQNLNKMKSLSGLEIEFLVTFSKLGNLSLGIQRRLNKDRAWEKNSASIKNTGKIFTLYEKNAGTKMTSK